MTAKEVREFRNASKKLVEVEERSKLLNELKRRNVCLGEEEYHVQKTINKFRVLNDKGGILSRQREEMVSLSLKYKIKDNNLYGKKLRRKKNWLKGKISATLGEKSRE